MKAFAKTFLMAVVLAGPLAADTSTPAFLASCKALTDGDKSKGAQCAAMLEGAIGAMGLIDDQFFPVSSHLGYCLDPFLTPEELAATITAYVAKDPDCANLAHFSMCLDTVLLASYSGTC